MEPKLTQRTYLGHGYIHQFEDIDTGELLIVPCTEQEFLETLSVQPVRRGYRWAGSVGGTIKVDTPNTILGKNEYAIVGDRAYVNYDGSERKLIEVGVDEIKNDTLVRK